MNLIYCMNFVQELETAIIEEKFRRGSMKHVLDVTFRNLSLFVVDYFTKRDISIAKIREDIKALDDSIEFFSSNEEEYREDLAIFLSSCNKDLRGDVRKESILKGVISHDIETRKFFAKHFDVTDFFLYLDDIEGIYIGDKESLESVIDSEAKINLISDDVPSGDVDEKLCRYSLGGIRIFDDEQGKEEDVTSFFTNVNEEVRGFNHHPAIGRDVEISKLIHILNKKNKPNCVLIGEAGVGKTAVVEGLAYNLENNIGENGILEGKKVYSLSVCSLISGTTLRGQAEARIQKVLEFFEKNEDAILFIDEFHMIAGAGATSDSDAGDLANIIKPYLSRGKIICIGATTKEEYQSRIQPDAALDRRFSTLEIKEPSVEDTVKILNGIKKQYEQHHHIRFGKNDMNNIVRVCQEMLPHRRFPDKAVDFIDGYGSYLHLNRKRASRSSFLRFCEYYFELNASKPSIGFVSKESEEREKLKELVR